MISLLLFVTPFWIQAQKIRESLDRGLIVIPVSSEQCYIGWRLLETDPKGIAFNVYRSSDDRPWTKINRQPVMNSTNLMDSTARLSQTNTWQVRPVIAGIEHSMGMTYRLPAGSEIKNYIDIPLQGSYGANKIGIGDLDGDGTYDYVIKHPRGSIDPGRQRHSPDTYKIEAYNGKSGKFMWRHDLGWNINMGIWFSPALVYDLDGDGKAEVALKTAPIAATMDESYESDKGFVLEGPEYCSVLDGETGQEITRVDWIERGDPKSWGDDRGNRVNRNQIGVACLDGETPSLLVMRGTYTKMFITAYRYTNNELEHIWSWTGEAESPPLRGQGGHSLHAFDIDDDGRDELIIGSAAIDDDGTVLWRMDMGHPDWCYLADVDPRRPGLELAYGFEDPQEENGICLADPKTGAIIWGLEQPTTHIHDWGLVANLIAEYPGMEIYGMERDGKTSWLLSSTGEILARDIDLGRHGPRSFYWLDGPVKVRVPFSYRDGVFPILKHKNRKIGEIRGQPLAIADCLGDWREEVITVSDGHIRIYTSTILSTSRHVCLMQDPLYRMDVAVQMMGYFYPPQSSRPLNFEKSHHSK